MEIYLLIGFLGVVTGVPPLFGLEPLPMQTVAGLTIVQGLLGCLAGGLIHKKFQFVSGELSLYMGVAIFITAAVGGAGASFVSNEILLFIFACLAFVAAFLMMVPVAKDCDRPDVADLKFNHFKAMTAASGVGLLGGLVGQGGSFILIPLMTCYVQIPTRIAIGSNLAIVFLSSIACFLGKAFTGQIEWLLVIPIAVTVVPAACLGGVVSQKVAVASLRDLCFFSGLILDFA